MSCVYRENNSRECLNHTIVCLELLNLPLLFFCPAVQRFEDNKLRTMADNAFLTARSRILDHDLAFSSGQDPVSSRGIDLELAYYPKLLLIAAFCASYNHPETDKRYFSRLGSGRSKKPRRAFIDLSHGSSSAARSQLPLPRTFTLERWTALFHALLAGNDFDSEARINNQSHATMSSRALQGQMTQLQQLRFVERISPPGELDIMRFRCQASLSSVSAVAQKVDIDLGKYLHSP